MQRWGLSAPGSGTEFSMGLETLFKFRFSLQRLIGGGHAEEVFREPDAVGVEIIKDLVGEGGVFQANGDTGAEVVDVDAVVGKLGTDGIKDIHGFGVFAFLMVCDCGSLGILVGFVGHFLASSMRVLMVS